MRQFVTKDTTISLRDAMAKPHSFFKEVYGHKCVCGQHKKAAIHQLAATPKQLAYRFFYANAGSSHNPKTETAKQGRAKGARRLAQAERDARALGYRFEWEEDYLDYENSLGDHAYWCEDAKNGVKHRHEIFMCSLVNADGNSVQTLGGIIEPSREYRRVVEAELALEELGKGGE